MCIRDSIDTGSSPKLIRLKKDKKKNVVQEVIATYEGRNSVDVSKMKEVKMCIRDRPVSDVVAGNRLKWEGSKGHFYQVSYPDGQMCIRDSPYTYEHTNFHTFNMYISNASAGKLFHFLGAALYLSLIHIWIKVR